LVIPPRRTRLPVVNSLETIPLYPIKDRGFSKRENDPTSATIVTAVILATPRKACRASITARICGGASAIAVSIAFSNSLIRSAWWLTSCT
jgi:hypothetical protein